MNGDLTYALFFWLFAALVVVSGAMTVYLRNIVKAALALFFTFFGMAGLFLMLGADFLAITQVVVYTGGILVLILIGIVVTHRTRSSLDVPWGRGYLAGMLAAAGFLVVLLILILGGSPDPWAVASTLPPPEPTSRSLGALLLTDYLLPFEVSSITLVMALLGASYLVRKKE